jgi:hypothetical protein
MRVTQQMGVFRQPQKPLCYHLIIFFLLFLVPNCTTVPKPPIQEPLNDQTTKEIITAIREQETKVQSFYAHGQIVSNAWYGQSEANILVVGKKSPFKMKIEITQSWGQPILHILIDQKRLEVLSFKDKTLYYAPFTPESLSRFFPGDIDPEFVWGTLRGYPNLINHDRVKSLRKDQISLFDGEGEEVEVIDLYPDTRLPRSVLFPGKRITLSYAEYQKNGSIHYAREVSLSHKGEKKKLALKNMKTSFNKPIPEQIFIQTKPPAFETRHLSPNG